MFKLKQAAQAAKAYGRDVALTAGVMLAPAISLAQSTDPFDTAIASMTTKVGGYGLALAIFSTVAVGFAIAIKYVKKLPRAS